MFHILLTRKPIPVSVIGVFETLAAASRQVDLFMLNNDPTACANIVPAENGGYLVQAIQWQ